MVGGRPLGRKPELDAAAPTMKGVGEAQLEAFPTAKRCQQGRAVAARPIAVLREPAASRALVDSSLSHLAQFTLALAGVRSGSTKWRMSWLPVPRPSRPASLGLLLLVGGASACSRSPTTEPAPAPSSAAPTTATPLAAGTLAPNVTFQVHSGEPVKLESLRTKPVVVYFYPKDDTPGCTVEAQEIRDLFEELKKTGAVVIGVSTDATDSHRAFAEKHALPFLLASDPEGEIAKAFGVPLKNGRAARVSFVIGADGRIKRTFPNVTPRGHAAELLTAISS